MSHHAGWSRALDIQMDTHKWASSPPGKLYNYGFFLTVLESVTGKDDKRQDIIDPAAQLLAQNYVETLWQADTMFVTTDMLHLLMQAAADLPEDTTFDDHALITKCGFCLFEEPLMGTDRKGKGICFHGMTWFTEVVGQVDEVGNIERVPTIIIYFLVDPLDSRDDYNKEFPEELKAFGLGNPPLTLQHFIPVKIGNMIPDNEDMKHGTKMVTNCLKLFVAMQLVAQQKIGEPMRLNPDRASRKRAARYEFPDKIITLITLRRKSIKKDDHEPQKVEWSRRWAVKGHWRRQYYPSTKTHDYVYIYEYIKGPEDKPFIPTERRIFNFRR